jgi:uncharacterized protein YjbI with pentapeptide repeats
MNEQAPPLTISPLSPVSCGVVLCRQGGILWATIVVKATFQLVHGGLARLLAPLALVQQDEPTVQGASVTRARETAPHMPNAGVVLTGHAHAPDGRAVPSMSVRLGISRERPLVDKTLHVFGSRAAANPTATMPFQKMPIVYERAFGGAGVWENPVGTGGPGSRALPNIVDPRDPRFPAGFGPLAGQWAPRRGFLAGAGPAALQQPIFETPRGFDWRYFQTAPVDQQLDGLRGDEWILLDGMHPQLARVQTRLPQVRALARRRTAGNDGADQPIELRGDMLVIDADNEVASLVWRGRIAVESAEAARRMTLLAGLEMPGRAVEWPAALPTQKTTPGTTPRPATLETQEVNLAALLGGDLPFDGEHASALPPPSISARPRSLVTGTDMVDLKKLFQQATPFAEAAATMELSALPAEGAFSPKATLEMHPTHDAPPLPFAPVDAAHPPAAAAPTPAGHKPTPMSTGTTDIDLAKILGSAGPFGAPPPTATRPADLEIGPPRVLPTRMAVVAPLAPPLALIAAVPMNASPAAVVPPSFPVPAVAPPMASPGVTPSLPVGLRPIPGAADDVRSAVLERVREGKSLEDLRLTGANFHEIDFRGASLLGLDLQRANLARAKLGGAKLAGARLCGANLSGADLSGADLGRADLSRAVLADTRFDGAMLIGAKLCDAEGKGPRFNDARLAQADLTGAVLPEATFNDIDAPGSTWDKASLGGAVFLGAKLRGAGFQGASLDKTSFTQADLASANFQRATGTATDLRAAKLEAADLRQAQLTNATFDDADLRDLSATRSDLSGARFFRADLSGANLRAAKLNGADFTQAKTDGADLRDAEIAGIKIDPVAARLLKLRLPR